MAATQIDYCPHCHLLVPLRDSKKVVNRHGVFHEPCWKHVKKIQDALNVALPRQPGTWVQ